MQIYESESSCFDSIGNISSGREIYYRVKGLYYMGVNQLDSAEYFFRKELREGKDFNNQNAAANGLAYLYHKTHKQDSAAKYAIYAYTMLDSVSMKNVTISDIRKEDVPIVTHPLLFSFFSLIA